MAELLQLFPIKLSTKYVNLLTCLPVDFVILKDRLLTLGIIHFWVTLLNRQAGFFPHF